MILFLDDAQAADGRAQGCQRVLDLVRHVGSELFVAVDPVVERADHAAQRARQAPDLVGAGGEVGDADAAGRDRALVAVAADLGGVGEVGDRVGDGRGQHDAQADGHQRGDDEHLQHPFPFGAHGSVDLDRGAFQRDDALQRVALQDRGEGGKDRLSARAAAGLDARLHRIARFDHAAQAVLLRPRRILSKRAEHCRDPVPETGEKIGDDGVPVVFGGLGGLEDRQGADGLSDQKIAGVEDHQLRAFAQVDARDRGRDVDAVARRQADRRAARQLRLEDVGDQFRFGQHRVGALYRERVARGVEVEDSGDQHVQRDKVEGDDLARQRRAVERKQAAPRPAGLQFLLDRAVGGDPVIAQHDICIPAFAGDVIAHGNPLGQRHGDHSSL